MADRWRVEVLGAEAEVDRCRRTVRDGAQGRRGRGRDAVEQLGGACATAGEHHACRLVAGAVGESDDDALSVRREGNHLRAGVQFRASLPKLRDEAIHQ